MDARIGLGRANPRWLRSREPTGRSSPASAGVRFMSLDERPPGTSGWRCRRDVSQRGRVTVENTVEIARSLEACGSVLSGSRATRWSWSTSRSSV